MNNSSTTPLQVTFWVNETDCWNAKTNESYNGYKVVRCCGSQGWTMAKFATWEAANAMKVMLEQNQVYELSMGWDIH